MTRFRENDRERAVDMVQAADHFNVFRITIACLMIRLRQTDRTYDRSRSGRPYVSSQRQDRHLRLFHFRNRMIPDLSPIEHLWDELDSVSATIKIHQKH